jgi:hypothetical protein
MIKIPAGATLIDMQFKHRGDIGFAVSVGDGGDAARFVAAHTASASTANTVASLVKGILPYTYSITANAALQYDTIDVKATVIAASTDHAWDLTVWYILKNTV